MSERSTVVCVTIVTESIVEARLVRDLRECGARGWTITPARGEGPRDRRVSDVDGGAIRVETLVSPATAEKIWERLADTYFADYAVTAWSHEVNVARLERYASTEE